MLPWDVLLPSLCLCFILSGIHTYLGLHVIRRGVIFVDLSLAQVASLGGLLSIFLFHEASPLIQWVCTLALTLGAATFLALANRQKKESQEALIGILFAFASAASVLVLDRIDHGVDHLKSSWVGNLLWVSWQDVKITAIIYALLSAVLFRFHTPLKQRSQGENTSARWDFLFYLVFAVTIACSVRSSGVLLVFSFLIVPAYIVTGFTQDWGTQLKIGWLISGVLATLGCLLSARFDLPTGAVVVSLFTLSPLVLTALRVFSRKS